MSNPTLTPIYSRLNGTDNYHPFTADTFADWTSEAGDTVVISRDGTDYSAPIHSQTLMWKGQHQISMESRGTKEREPIEKMSNRKYGRGGGGASAGRTARGKTFIFEANQDHLLYEIDNPETGLMGRMELTEEAATTLYQKTGVNSLGQDETLYSLHTQTAGQVSTIVAKTGINSLGANETLYSEISQEHDRINLVVQGSGASASIKIGAIVDGINASAVRIDAQRVYIGNEQSTTVINGKLNTDDVTATYLGAVLTNSSVLSTNYAFSRTLECNSFVQGDYDCFVPDAMTDIRLTPNENNTYSIYKKGFTHDWVLVGTFSRATSGTVTLTGEWSGDVSAGKSYKVVASDSESTTIYSPPLDGYTTSGNQIWDGDNKGFTQTVIVYDEDGEDLFSDQMHFSTLTSWTAGSNAAGVVADVESGTVHVEADTSTKSVVITADVEATYNPATHRYSVRGIAKAGDSQMDSVTDLTGTEAYVAGQTYGVDSVKGNWTKSGGVLNITKGTSGTAFPLSFTVTSGISYNPSSHSYTANAYCDDDWMDSANSGTEAYEAGYTNGSPSSGATGGRSGSTYNWTFSITKGDGTTASLTIDASAIYSDARSGYTQGTFRRAALTLRGSQISNAYQAVDTGGTMYYTKGSTVYYGRGTLKTTKEGGNNVGFKRHSSTETPTGTWYSIVSTGASVSYFTQKNASFGYYPGDGPSGYFANTSSLKRFTSITAYNSGTSYDTSNSPYYTKS